MESQLSKQRPIKSTSWDHSGLAPDQHKGTEIQCDWWSAVLLLRKFSLLTYLGLRMAFTTHSTQLCYLLGIKLASQGYDYFVAKISQLCVFGVHVNTEEITLALTNTKDKCAYLQLPLQWSTGELVPDRLQLRCWIFSKGEKNLKEWLDASSAHKADGKYARKLTYLYGNQNA